MGLGYSMDRLQLAKAIDHTLLKPDATAYEIAQLCGEARDWSFYAVCIHTSWVPLAKEFVRGSAVKVVSVAGFPLGACSSSIKRYEIEQAIGMGADEVDFVQNIGLLKERSLSELKKEFDVLVKASGGIPLKVIIETALLDEEEKVLACQLACDAGIAFVKTSSGFLGGGATVRDVALMRQVVGQRAGVKASAGIRDEKTAWAMLQAGANRLGTSAGVSIMGGDARPAVVY